MNKPNKRIAIFVSFSGQGGVERMITNLAQGMLNHGVAVDMVLIKAKGDHLEAIPKAVNIIKLRSKHSATALFELTHYLRTQRPDALLAVKHRAIQTAVLARRLSGLNIPLAGRLGTTVSAALEGKNPIRKWLWYHNMRKSYWQVDTIIPVSQGVAQDVQSITQLPDARLQVVRNPVITPELYQKASEEPNHPWFNKLGLNEPNIPIVIGAGRLTKQKDFPTLLRAFARVRQQRVCRLMILGEGNDRTALQQLAQTLNIEKDVDLFGFTSNPFQYISRAQVFVLSSLWEGSPNSLTEALALGTPVVSTDCPSGPIELLDQGRFGPLVNMGDDVAMAEAISATLDHPLDKTILQSAVQDYNREQSARAYLKILGIQ